MAFIENKTIFAKGIRNFLKVKYPSVSKTRSAYLKAVYSYAFKLSSYN